MNTLVVLAGLAVAASTAIADTAVFQTIATSAAAINRDAVSINQQLKAKTVSVESLRPRIDDLGKDIGTLRQAVDEFDQRRGSLTARQLDSWEKVKLKAQLLTIFYDNKVAALNAANPEKHRQSLRAHAMGIAERAALLEKTANGLSK